LSNFVELSKGWCCCGDCISFIILLKACRVFKNLFDVWAKFWFEIKESYGQIQTLYIRLVVGL